MRTTSLNRQHLIAIIAILAVSLLAWRAVAAERILIFAAASIAPAIEKIGADYGAKTGTQIIVSAASSAALARQIEAGAPADIFISANTDWMAWLDARNKTVKNTAILVAANQLVLIQTGKDRQPMALADLPAQLGEGRLAVGLTQSVPVGIYAKQALTAMGLWEDLSDRLAETDNAPAAVQFAAVGQTPFAIVYRSDVIGLDAVSIVAQFDAATHDPIVYPAAIIKRDPNQSAAGQFLEFLKSDSAKEVFVENGFSLPEQKEG